jgi:DNA polymerase-3 subunit epsilon
MSPWLVTVPLCLASAGLAGLLARRPLRRDLLDAEQRVAGAQRQRDEALSSAKQIAERESSRLAALLNDLHEGVLVCNLAHQIVLYNQTALKLLRFGGEMGLGRPLFAMLAMEPVQHCLDMLQRRSAGETVHMPFLSRTHDSRSLLQGRLSLVRASGQPSGYVITFDDVTDQVGALAKRDALLREVIEMLEHDLPQDALAHARQGYRSLLSGWWPMSDILSGTLFDMVVGRLAQSPIQATAVGLPVWLHGDGHSLVLALDALLRALSIGTGATEFDLSAEAEDGKAWVIVSWAGPRPAEQALRNWETVPISPAMGGMSVRDVMAHHATEDPVVEARDDRLCLKLALRPARHPPLPGQAAEIGSSRPEFFDFDLLEQSQGDSLADLSLRELTYVVFDTETTGLHPGAGDRIVSLAGVRIVRGRILTGESFNRIVNPGRAIPALSTRFHGLTDDQVAGKPPIEVVLPQFKSFVADSVLVAHNAAFDLKFLRMFEAQSGVSFDNPVLDTMLLATFLDERAGGQSLDDLCRRYGVIVSDRHTALGDSLATAALLLHLITDLEAKGVRTLGEALTRSNMALQLHHRAQAL